MDNNHLNTIYHGCALICLADRGAVIANIFTDFEDVIADRGLVDVGPADFDGSDGTTYQFTIDRIPEPSAMALLLGGFALALRRRR